MVSREHAQLEWTGRLLKVRRLPHATNPIFFHGEQVERLRLALDDHFVIGRTHFRLVDDHAQVSLRAPAPVSRQAFTADFLRRAAFHRAQQQVQALTRLPEIIAGADSDQELYTRLVSLILSGVSSSEAAAVVEGSPAVDRADDMRVLHWDWVGPREVELQPSAPLIREALRTGQSVVHYWRQEPVANEPPQLDPEFDWAFCSPLPGTACRGRAIYVAGNAVEDGTADTAQGIEPIDLQDALKFVELVGTTVGNVCDLRRLQERSSALAQFFSPPVRQAVAAADPERVLAPRKTEVSVLFCDLRGFSRHSEQSAEDLFGLLTRVSEALGIMTRRILDFGGVIGDFHGDAAMGFWGWPLPDEQRAVHACQAALSICAAFHEAAQRDRHALAGFRVGMGLATGQAVAGKLGTVDQVKVTAFGPVVNLASRLEGLTRRFGVAILIDAPTARAAQAHLSAAEGRVRPVARLQPYGMTGVEDVFELVSGGHDQDAAAAADELLGTALNYLRRGDWTLARPAFIQMPTQDPVRHFYLKFLEEHANTPPADWDGVVRFADKS
jgi:adenylate cyclase